MKKIFVMTNGPIEEFNIDNEQVEVANDFIFLGSNVNKDSDCSVEIRRRLLLGRKAMVNPRQANQKQRYQYGNKDPNDQNDGLPNNNIWL